jgi:anthraniloyl-CoA monooxygenase
MKKADRRHDITVYERNRPYDTFGWGVVFSDQTLENLAGADEESRAEIIDSLAHWDDIDVHFKGRVITSGGHGFCGIERKRLLNILQARAEALGVKLVFETEIEDPAQFADSDLTTPRPSSWRRRRRFGRRPDWRMPTPSRPSPSAKSCSPNTWTATP